MACGVPQGFVQRSTLQNSMYDGFLDDEMPQATHLIAFVSNLAIVVLAKTPQELKAISIQSFRRVEGTPVNTLKYILTYIDKDLQTKTYIRNPLLCSVVTQVETVERYKCNKEQLERTNRRLVSVTAGIPQIELHIRKMSDIFRKGRKELNK